MIFEQYRYQHSLPVGHFFFYGLSYHQMLWLQVRGIVVAVSLHHDAFLPTLMPIDNSLGIADWILIIDDHHTSFVKAFIASLKLDLDVPPLLME